MAIGNMQYGTNNNAGADRTDLTSTADLATLYVQNSWSGHGFARVAVYAASTGGAGVIGTSTGNEGVQGWAGAATASGVYGANTAGGYGVTGIAAAGIGVRATSNSGVGLHASTKTGLAAILATHYEAAGFGVYSASWNIALYGTADVTGALGIGGAEGVRGISQRGNGVVGQSHGQDGSDSGVRGQALGSNGTGVWGEADNGANAFGLFGASIQGWAGVFSGRVRVLGSLFKTGGGFEIDHPLDPANKCLRHSFVESPDMMNVYNGNLTTDSKGDATVTLPDYFETLNCDFRYQLTVIGQFAQAIIIEEIRDNRFAIRSDKPNVKVSWQVTGIRQDAYATAHPLEVETEKPEDERGTYLMPQEHGQPNTVGTLYKRIQAAREQIRPAPVTEDERIGTMRERDEAIINRDRPRTDPAR
jgi:hypothetical protein